MKFTTMTLGGGGKQTNDFIKEFILKKLGNTYLNQLRDASVLDINSNKLAFTTDSFVVMPEFFPGGDIGKLAVYGTCNDLAVSGAKPLYLSLSFVISEGYGLKNVARIISSIKEASEEVGVSVVCGDTKVIERSENIRIIINTAGIGLLQKDINDYTSIVPGDKVIFTSDIGRHGLAVLSERGEFNLDADIKSDCGNLYEIFRKIGYNGIKFARDATRGGVAAVLNEISEKSGFGFLIEESEIPVEQNVKYLLEFLGLDMFNVANEGVAVIICESEQSDSILKKLKTVKISKNAKIVGEVTEKNKVILRNEYGGLRVVEMPDGNLLPRIC
ncbi:MAG: hydrogenase expression/formation protein HypE [Deferribacteres bacterium]|jgi:hydrogenase expression/formation protein HypE|nr:hydrogenase expression/formation protein HypE [Deferribacteraceae bacterium]MDK2792003.1 hydrogenase expression/formation protein HypE [Deferribacteres bacterium]